MKRFLDLVIPVMFLSFVIFFMVGFKQTTSLTEQEKETIQFYQQKYEMESTFNEVVNDD